jgi:acetyl-CoA carboxylase carboxyl transferase subunit alpha
MTNYLDFEKPLAEIEGKAEELRALARQSEGMDVEAEAAALDKKAADMLVALYKDLTPWRKCQVARHPDRPHCSDYIKALFTEYTPLAGDRNFADDAAVMGGLARAIRSDCALHRGLLAGGRAADFDHHRRRRLWRRCSLCNG